MKLVYRQHAITRMFERSIKASDVDAALAVGRVIENYPTDTPYPSCLWLGYSGARPLHIVFAEDTDEQIRIIITVYEPSPAQWEPNLATRRQP